jgi:hypothetical protein
VKTSLALRARAHAKARWYIARDPLSFGLIWGSSHLSPMPVVHECRLVLPDRS